MGNPRAVTIWTRRVGIFVLIEIGWFGLLFPLVPSTLAGLAIALISGALVTGVLWATALGMCWLAGGESHSLLRRSTALVLAVSVGVAIFAAAYLYRDTLSSNFHHFLFSR